MNGLSKIMKKPIPRLKSEDAGREFWANHDSAEFIDWRKGKRTTLPNLKPSSQTISLRLPKPMLARLKLLANKRDVPYQSLLKMFVADRLKRELELPDQEPESR
jgi:predicted DNA binding CopG/RHH family protein